LPVFNDETILTLKAHDADRSPTLHFSLRSHTDVLKINSSSGKLHFIDYFLVYTHHFEKK